MAVCPAPVTGSAPFVAARNARRHNPPCALRECSVGTRSARAAGDAERPSMPISVATIARRPKWPSAANTGPGSHLRMLE